MASSTHSAVSADWSALLPDVHLEVRQAGSRATTYALGEVDFLIGSVPGCDLRVAGAESPAVLCLLARHPGGVTLRKLAPAQTILVNGRAASHLDLAEGDRIQIGLVEILVRLTPARTAPAVSKPQVEQAYRELQERAAHLREQLVNFQKEKEAFAQERDALGASDGRAAVDAWESERSALQEQIDERDRLLTEHAAEIALLRQAPVDAATPTAELASQRADLEQREQALAERKHLLEGKLQQYEADVLRLDRWQGTLEQRERDITRNTEELAQERDRLQRESAELETQLLQIDEWRAKLADEVEQLAAAKQEHAARDRELTERVNATEGQQATLTVLRTRIERMREEIRVRQHQLDEQQAQQDAREAEIAAKTLELLKLQTEIESEQSRYESDRKQWLERSAVLETAVRQLKLAQEKLAVDDERVHRQTEEFEQRGRQMLESEAVLQRRLEQLAETRERLDLELNALRDRSVNLLERETACEALQEQLRRRSEEVERRHKELADQLQAHDARSADLDDKQRQLDQREEESRRQREAWQQEMEQKSEAVRQQHAELSGFEERYQEQLNQIAIERRALAEEQARYQLEQQTALAQLADQRAAFEAMRNEATELIRQLPDAELRAGTALDRLSHARTQMRDHLAEIHRYVRQCRDELERVRGRLQTELDGLREQEEVLRRGQDEHRLAMAAFRQQLIDWQGQIAELKRLLARDETRLERKKEQVDERARAMEAESQRLAKQAEELQEQERDVADRRQEIDGHLVEMREWYRGKLRELAGIALTPTALLADREPTILPATVPNETDAAATEDGEPALVPVGRGILSISGSTDPGDQKLGLVLRESQLIDSDTLTALLAEARRQRRSLRQVLLTSGVITLYQLALIEAGNLGGLMLGPVRAIDRIRHNTHESVYRVFDPRRGTEAVLRHLSETDSADATRPDEFRQRFGQAMLNDPHLANTLEVFDLLGRPAVLQEWLPGLPATDWPPLTAAPGVCYRLLTQAAQGLATAHHAGVVHGRLSDGLFLLTGDGVLKIAGLGDPPWLVGVTHEEDPTPRDDLRALGTIVSGWCTPSGVRKGAKTKPLPDALVSVLYRLAADSGAGYRDVRELLLDLEKAAGDIPPNAEAWDRLLKYVREHGSADAMVRQSA